MTMAPVYNPQPVYGKEHRILKRRTLALSFLDLILITSAVVFVLVQLVSIGVTFSSSGTKDVNSSVAAVSSAEKEISEENKISKEEEYSDSDMYPTSIEHDGDKAVTVFLSSANETVTPGCNSTTGEGCQNDDSPEDDGFLYKTVVGARISLSIQMIIYIAQLGFGVLLFIAAYHNDSRNLHLWVLFSEVIVVVIGLELFINFFGKFMWSVVAITGVYILFKIFLIRLVRRFIHVNDLELTQFGSVVDFE